MDSDYERICKRHPHIPQDGFDLEALMPGYERTWRDDEGNLQHEHVETDD